MNNFKEITAKEIPFTPFDIKEKWMLITAEKAGKVNTMTASWGGFGIMWGKEVVSIVIRPQRYTKEFIDSSDSFSLTLFNKSYLKQLGYLGKVSGRHENKIDKAGLTLKYDSGIPFFDEAEAALFATKLYAQPLKEEFFIDKSIVDKCYPEKDFHTIYVGEITKILLRK